MDFKLKKTRHHVDQAERKQESAPVDSTFWKAPNERNDCCDNIMSLDPGVLISIPPDPVDEDYTLNFLSSFVTAVLLFLAGGSRHHNFRRSTLSS